MITITIKPLLPSLRERKRYLVYEVISEKPMNDFSSVQQQLKSALQQFLGEYGLAKLHLRILPEKWNSKMQRGIMRLSHTGTNLLKATLLFVHDIEQEPVIVRSIAVSGTIKKASTYLTRGG